MVLLKDHQHLGKKGDIVKVKAGHARQILFPQGEADYAIPSVIRDLKARGLLSQQALQQLQPGAQQRGAAGRRDPASLPLEQQLPQIIKLLTERHLVISRRFSRKSPEQHMLGPINRQLLALHTARQLGIILPPQLILMDQGTTIDSFGAYKVPLNLRDSSGQQVELSVLVNKTYRAPGLHGIKTWAQERGLLPPGMGLGRRKPRQQRQGAGQPAATGGQQGEQQQGEQKQQQQQQPQQQPAA